MTEYFQVHNGNRILRGILHVGTTAESVIIVHGYFSANKIGAHRLYVQMANMIAQIGFNVLRIDLSGMGESDGDISEFDFADHVLDVSLSVQRLMERTGSSKVHYIGHCIGTCTAFQNALQNTQSVDSLTLISPFMPSEDNYKKLMITDQNYYELQTTGLTLRKGLVCRKSFIDAGYIINNYPEFCRHNKLDCIIYFPQNDEMVNIENFVQWSSINNLCYKVIPEADHNFINSFARSNLFSELERRFLWLYEKQLKKGK